LTGPSGFDLACHPALDAGSRHGAQHHQSVELVGTTDNNSDDNRDD
jgi:hypothetical protein